MQHSSSRRDFIQQAALAAGTVSFLSLDHPSMATPITPAEGTAATVPPILVFSKHLQFLDYQEMANKAKEIGFDGIDLTVRPGGHVLPERVQTDLPKAVEAINKAGLRPMMMTTAVENASGTDEIVLKTAAKLGIKYYRMNWYKYSNKESMPDSLKKYQEQIRGLSVLNSKLGLVGCYQNHAGKLIGASAWELYQLMQRANIENMGLQYDIRHATVEGGLSWENGLRLLNPYVKILAIKDFVWAKENGKYVVKNVPLGEGMIDFKTYFRLLREYGVQVPISMHYEYDLGGAEHGSTKPAVDREVIYEAMQRDLVRFKDMWTNA
jgi:sugar phosphate isomerase/epimerase